MKSTSFDFKVSLVSLTSSANRESSTGTDPEEEASVHSSSNTLCIEGKESFKLLCEAACEEMRLLSNLRKKVPLNAKCFVVFS